MSRRGELYQMSEEEHASWSEWLAARPAHVRVVAERHPPNRLFRLRGTGQYVTVYSVCEHEGGRVTVTVDVTGQYNCVTRARRVFGIAPDDIEDCDVPGPEHPTGDMGLDPGEVLALMSLVDPNGYRDIVARRARNSQKEPS